MDTGAFVSVEQIASALGIDKRNIQKRAAREAWKFQEEQSRGRHRRRRYVSLSLPTDVREALARQLASAAPSLPVTVETTQAAPTDKRLQLASISTGVLPAATQLTSWQREIAIARKALLDEVRRIGATSGLNRALDRVMKLAAAGALAPHLQGLVDVANARRGEARVLSRTSVFRWMRLEAKDGLAGLAPKPTQKHERAIPAWAPALLRLYQQPQKYALAYCIEQLPGELAAGVPMPSYHQARRFLAKVSNVDRERGRLGPQALKAIRPYVRRDTSHMTPGDGYTSDGHTFDAEVAHPAHGRPFRPELTPMIDIATRRVVGWSAGLAESTWTVADALRNAVETSGICAIWYVDRGPGNKNKVVGDEALGIATRCGITISYARPRNPQGHGLSERHHQTIFVRAAKKLATYMGAAMDREARNNVFKITRAELRAAGTSRLLMPWPEFLKFIQAEIDAYNARPHRALPKIRDVATGKLRHMSPDEAWQKAIDEGWEPARVSAGEIDDLFRPYKLCSVLRAQVTLFGNTYFHPALEHYHGTRLAVGYDIHDATQVWVRDAAGRLICKAVWEANREKYFPQAFVDRAREKRGEQRMARLQARVDEVQAELYPPAVLDNQVDIALEAPMPENVVPLPAAADEARPSFFGDDGDAQKYRWLLAHRDEWTAEDQGWMDWYRTTSEWFDLFGDVDAASA